MHFTRTRNLTADSPTWEELARPGHVTGSNRAFMLDPVDPQNIGYMLTWVNGAYGYWLYKITNMDSASPTWTEIMSAYRMAELYQGKLPPTAFQLTMYDFDVNPQNNQNISIQGSTQALGQPNGYYARSFDGGATWQFQTHFSVGRVQDKWNKVSHSEHGLVDLYITPGSDSGLNDLRLFWSADAGSNWSDLWGADTNLWHVPYQGNAADLGMYIAIGDGAAKKLYYSENRGLPASRIEITPSYLGTDYSVVRGGGGAGLTETRKTNLAFCVQTMTTASPG